MSYKGNHFLNVPGQGSSQNQNQQQQQQQQQQQGAGVTTTTIGGSKPKTIHIAHRRSPSELTSLMIEQFNLQRQLEAVQAQQQQILQQQQHHPSSHSQSYSQQQQQQQQSLQPHQLQPPTITTTSASHNRNSSSFGGASGAFGYFQAPPSVQAPPHNQQQQQQGFQSGHNRRMSNDVSANNNSHRRTPSNMGGFSMPLAPPFKSNSPVATPPNSSSSNNTNTSTSGGSGTGTNTNNQAMGHTRRHSLGLNEAKKAAAMMQSQRSGNSPSKLSNTASTASDNNTNYYDDQEEQDSPVTSSMPPPSFKFPATPPTSNDSSNSSSSIKRNPSHGRSRSMMTNFNTTSSQNDRSPQRSFQFPMRSTGGGSNEMAPPAPQFQTHDRRQSGGHFRTGSRNDSNLNWRRPSPSNSNNSMNMTYQQQNQQSLSIDQTPPSSSSSGSTFVPGHRAGRSSFGGSISSLANYGGHPQQMGPGGSQRKSLFAPYLPQSSLPALIAEGRLVTGTLRVNKKNRSDAYVSTDGLLDADIFICGSKDRNRALEGDLVAVELLIVDEVWSSKREKEEKKRRKDNTQPSSVKPNDDVNNDALTTYSSSSNTRSNGGALSRKGSLKQRPTQKKNDDVEVEGQSLLLVEEEEISDEYKPLYAGHVVAVVDRIPGQLFSGTLGLLRPSQASKEKDSKENSNSNNNDDEKDKDQQHSQPQQQQHHQNRKPKIVWFKPTDKKVPLIAIPTEQAPKDFVENHEKYSGELFVASIKRWPITSLHPFGTLVSQLGPIEEQSTEIDAILRDNNFLCDEYPLDNNASSTNTNTKDFDKLYAELPLNFDEAFNDPNRKLLSSEYIICTSQTGDISDHAFHVKSLSNTGKIEVGVHISDVSYGVKQGSTLDKKAKKRSHSVFLPQRTTHLFPSKVNDMFSFKENEKNLAMSVIFEIDTTTFEIDSVWIGETVIVPKQKISYESIDKILSGAASANDTPEVSNATADYMRTLSLISREFKRQRLGDAHLESQPMLPLFDQLDDERVKLTMNILDSLPSSALVDELFHKVNFTVAQKIFSKLGDRTMLRRHAVPTLQKLETYHKKVAELGVDLDTSTSATLQLSVLKIENENVRKSTEALLHKCMARGKYTIAAKSDPEQFPHYLFNLPLYTHFTAPLRRYADIMVHRQLKAVIFDKVEEYTDDIESLKMTADYCNFKKDCAKAAQEQAIHLLLSQSINEISKNTGQLLCMGTVLQVYESSFDVLIPEMGIEKRVHGDQLPLTKAEFDKKNRVLELYWEKGVDSATFIPEDENDALSYRASIKNKHRSAALDVAKEQSKAVLESSDIVSDVLVEKLAKFNIAPPRISIPTPTLSTKENQLINEDKMKTTSAPTTPRENKWLGGGNGNTRTFSSSLINPTSVPSRTSSTNTKTATTTISEENSSDSSSGLLNAYLKNCVTRVENDNYIQEITVLQQVPVLLRAEIGMALPCLTVRALNPFTNTK